MEAKFYILYACMLLLLMSIRDQRYYNKIILIISENRFCWERNNKYEQQIP